MAKMWVRTERKALYLHESQRELDVYLQGDHGEEIYCAFRDNRADHGRKLEDVHIAVRAPSNNDECG